MKKSLTLLFAGALLAVSTAAVPAPETAHFGLRTSSPEAGASVEAPQVVRVWFTEEPQQGTVQLRLVEAEDVGVHVTDAVQDDEDSTSFSIELHGTLPAGAYTVSWRGMGADGHVVRDTFAFTVSGAR